jgi:hypothetical protein
MFLLMAVAMASATPLEMRVRREWHAAPRPVRAFLVRRAGCNHWGGEEGYDAERAAQIAEAARKLRCRWIDADEKRIRRKYAGSRRVRWLLRTTRDWDTMP